MMKAYTVKAQLGIALLVSGVLLITGCSQASDSVTIAAGSAASGSSPVDLNAYHPEDMKFYGPMQKRMEGTLLVRPPANVKAATEKASVVVAARVGDIAAQRVIGDVQTVGLLLTGVEVLHGKLELSLAGRSGWNFFSASR